MSRTCPPLTEVVPILEVFATGIRRVRYQGEIVRLTFYSEQDATFPEVVGERERVVVAKIVMARADFCAIVRKIVDAPSIAM